MKFSEAVYEYSSIKKTRRYRRICCRSFKARARAALLILLATAMVMMLTQTLFYRIELTRQNDTNVTLQRQFDELCEENRHLKIEYESLKDLAEIEKTAVNELGMKNIAQKTAEIIHTDAQDRAQIVGG